MNRQNPARRRAFTLIELLIVVAIIAILAAIAVPNFLEAQVRAKVSRVKADQRTVMIGVESYRVDHTAYPPDLQGPNANYIQPPMHRLLVITTPIAYLASLPFLDPFSAYAEIGTINVWNELAWLSQYEWRNYNQMVKWGDPDGSYNLAMANEHGAPACWIESRGPDRTFFFIGLWDGLSFEEAAVVYDSTNGTASWGDIRTFSSGRGKRIEVTP